MKKILLASAALTFVSAGAVLADEYSPGGWYLGAGVGANWVNDVTADTIFGLTVETEFDTGWAVTGDIGYRWWDSNLRLALELGYRQNDVEAITYIGPPGTNADGELTQLSAMVNMLFDFDLGENLNLTLGGGLGVVDADFEATSGPTDFIDDAGDDWSFAYQGIAGLAFETSDQSEFYVEYRYFVNEKHEIVTFPPPNIPLATEVDFENHTATIGFRYFLEGPPPPAAAETPATPPADTAPQTYIVFFDFNKSNLTAEAQAVVAEAAEGFKTTGSARVVVVGHTDTVGSAGYNQALSERRAASVAAEMVRLGVPADAIATEGRGFSDPMVPTGPGVREPQNRRAVIELQ